MFISYPILLIISFFYISIVEYLTHKYLMHTALFGKNFWWKEHSLEHHAHNRNDVNIGLNPLSVLFFIWPLFFGYFLVGYFWILIVILFDLLYCLTWTCLHGTYHNVSGPIVQKIVKSFKYYEKWKNHHLNHHKNVSKNFGTVFIWPADQIFGTKI